MAGKSKTTPELSLEKELNLSRDFPPPTYEQWKVEAEKSLGDLNWDQIPLFETDEGIQLKPIYRKADIQELPFLSNLPGFVNYLRGTRVNGYLHEPWEICQEISGNSVAEFNRALNHDIRMGQTTVNLILDRATRTGWDADTWDNNKPAGNGLSISNLADLATALSGIDLNKYPLYIQAGISSVIMIMLVSALVGKRGENSKNLKGSIEADPLGMWVLEGKLPIPFASAIDHMKWSIHWTDVHMPGIKTIGIDASLYHNAGASAIMELAFALGTAVEYINQLQDRGLSIDQISRHLRFTFGVGSFFFMEIAKLRAARVLWTNIAKEYGASEQSRKMSIHARTSFHNQTATDPYMNILRTTTEALSAIIGGVDSLHTNTFGESFSRHDEFSRRVARNTQLVLLHESHIDQPIDPGGGSYYIESLTSEIARKSWSLFQKIESLGGMHEALKAGFLQDRISRLNVRRKTDIARCKKVIVGANRYLASDRVKKHQNQNDAGSRMQRQEDLKRFRISRDDQKWKSSLKNLSLSLNSTEFEIISKGIRAFLNHSTLGEVSSILRRGEKESISVERIEIWQASQMFEELKANLDKQAIQNRFKPRVLIIPYGKIPQLRDKVNFSREFFEMAGFEVIHAGEAKEITDLTRSAVQSQAQIAVICSADSDIIQILTRSLKQLKPDLIIVLAGDPKGDLQKCQQVGIEEFIYPGVDVYQVLKKIIGKIGMH